jgi:hypothetical protein
VEFKRKKKKKKEKKKREKKRKNASGRGEGLLFALQFFFLPAVGLNARYAD